MKDREIIFGLLRKVARRMRITHLLGEAGFAVGVVFVVLAAYQLIRIPLSGMLGQGHQFVLAVSLGLFCIYVLVRALRRVTLMQAAALADSRRPLHDELKSALWFASRETAIQDHGSQSQEAVFVRAHVANAARTAEHLNAGLVAPLRFPRTLWFAALGALIFVTAMWGSANLVRAGAVPRVEISVTPGDDESPRALLSASASDEKEVQQLDQALAVFEKSNASAEQRERALVEARDAVDQLNMRASSTREGLAKIARAMRNQPGFEKIAEALEQGRTGDAIAMLQNMQKELANRDGETDDIEEQQAGGSERAEAGPAQELGDIARQLLNEGGRVSEETVSRLLKNLEEAEQAMQTQQRANAAQARMDEMGEMVGMTQTHSEMGPTAYSDQSETPMGTPSPDTGQSDMRGGTMYRQGSVMPNEQTEGDDGSTSGAPDGHAAALALEGRATKRLDATLKLEKVRVSGSDEEQGNDGEESAWFYAASQQEAADTALEDVRGRADYAGAGVMRPGRVPMEQRQAVRDYFINIHEGDKQ